METTVSNREMGREESETIGEGNLISIFNKQKEEWLQYGTVSVTNKSRIEIHRKGSLLWDKVIMGEQYRKENIKITGESFQAVCWKDERGQDYGLIFKNSEMRDELFGYIKQKQKDGVEEEMGFGLFD